jgi:alpha-tubulin suppressor-like RCC1 family protein
LAATKLVAASGSSIGWFACAVVPGNEAYCWGSNVDGQLGTGVAGVVQNAATKIPVSDAVEVASFTVGACARQAEGTVACWGENQSGELGNSTATPGNYTPVPPSPVPGLGGVSAIAAGPFHVCAAMTDGGVACWGYDEEGQVGNGVAETNAPTPATVAGLTDVVALSAGFYATCAVTSDHAVWCWGGDGKGDLGTGALDASLVPVRVPLPDAVQVAVGSGFACALLQTGAVACWGDNTDGELGIGAASVNPLLVPSLVTW